MQLEYLILFITSDYSPVLLIHAAGKYNSNLIVWRGRAFLKKALVYDHRVYQEVLGVAFLNEPSEQLLADDLAGRFTSRLTPVVFEDEGEKAREWICKAAEIIQQLRDFDAEFSPVGQEDRLT